MNIVYRIFISLVSLSVAFASIADNNVEHINGFVHRQSAPNDYEWPTDPKVLEKLDEWQDLKFGVLIHWGLYSKPGIVESWSICSEDVDWITRKGNLPYDEYKKWYWSLKDSLNPVNLNPGQWADVMKDAGMKYMIFTTKHHDGFCTFDSRYTDFSIANGPFSTDPRKNVAKEVFDAFRNKGFMAGCYFSKPDWHCEWFWNPEFATPNRHINYKKERHPEWWQNYVDFTSSQLKELLTDYGHFDILWLDGGWITGDEIGLDGILETARRDHPGLIAVDRSIRGKNENYQTPERGIPSEQLPYPWESCIPLSNDWGWVPDAPFKSPRKIISTLAEITAKGGCLALGIGPTADGVIEDEVIWRLREIGDWLKVNGVAIYNTRPTPLYNDGKVWFTADKIGNTLFAIYTLEDGENLPETIEWNGNIPDGKITLLSNGRQLKYRVENDKVIVKLPRGLKNEPVALEFSLKRPTDTVPLYRQPTAPVDMRVSDLLSRMTIEEKIGQLRCPLGWEMYTRTGNTADISDKFISDMCGDMPPGSYWAVLRADPWTQKTLENGLHPALAAEVLNKMQRFAVENTRLGIPLLFAEETPHGHMAIGATVFPTGLGMASTWNPELLYAAGEAIALEARLQGANIGYGPVLDIARDPRWSRMEETFGEDPVLTSCTGVALMKGMQGDTRNDGRHLYSTLKHFAAYGVPEGGHNGARAVTGQRQLLSEYLPPFRKAVEEGATTIMTSYNSVDGIPCTSNVYLLQELLRDRWGFNGFIFSDLYSIDGIVGAHAATDLQHAGELALKAGVDVDLGANAYGPLTLKSLSDGKLTIDDLDRAVARVLKLKFEMGLFENPYVSPLEAETTVGSAPHKNLAREVARQGTVLLKNNGVLPLDKNISSIAVIGPNADTQYNQLGDYTAPQDEKNIITVLEGVREAVSPTTTVNYVKGCAVRDTTESDIPLAVEAARNSDAVILVVGGSSARDFKTSYISTGAATVSDNHSSVLMDMDCGEGFDRSTLSLLGDQPKLLDAVLGTGKPVIVVYIQGRPLDMTVATERADALLTAWYPGGEGGRAIADILFGDYNPSGRLPVSIPLNEGQLPLYYSLGERPDYMDGSGNALYPFGFGLSYTTFEYSDLEITPGDDGDTLQRISCVVTNTGNRDGREVVQLYIRDLAASVIQPPLLLKAFRNVELKKGESRKVVFDLKARDLSIVGTGMEEILEPGEFAVMIGSSSRELPLKGKFNITGQ